MKDEDMRKGWRVVDTWAVGGSVVVRLIQLPESKLNPAHVNDPSLAAGTILKPPEFVVEIDKNCRRPGDDFEPEETDDVLFSEQVFHLMGFLADALRRIRLEESEWLNAKRAEISEGVRAAYEKQKKGEQEGPGPRAN